MQVPVPEGFVFRPASLSDHDAILDLDPEQKINDGLDYVPARLRSFLTDPDRRCYVLEKDGRVIAFQLFHVIDNGTTAIGTAWRMHPEYQGKGLFPYFREAIKPVIREMGIKSYVTMSTKKALHMKRIRQGKKDLGDIIMIRKSIKMSISAEHIATAQRLRDSRKNAPYWLSKAEIHDALSNRDNHFRLFVNGRMHHNFDTYKCTADGNIKKILETTDGVTGTPVEASSVRKDHRFSSLSFRSVYPMSHGAVPRMRHNLDYYGNEINDLLQHFIMHLAEMNSFQSNSEELKLFVKFPVKFDQIEVQKRLQNLGIKTEAPSELITMEVDLEKDRVFSKL